MPYKYLILIIINSLNLFKKKDKIMDLIIQPSEMMAAGASTKISCDSGHYIRGEGDLPSPQIK